MGLISRGITLLVLGIALGAGGSARAQDQGTAAPVSDPVEQPVDQPVEQSVETQVPQAAPQASGTQNTAPQQSDRAQRLIFPVLVFDRARVFSDSQIALDMQRDMVAASEALSAENKTVEAELEAEEMALAQQRPNMSEEAFRDLATAFDDKVTELRAQQDAKLQDLLATQETRSQEVENTMRAMLTQLARQFGAVIVFESQQVYLSSSAIDVTDILIRQLDLQSSDTSTPSGEVDQGSASQE